MLRSFSTSWKMFAERILFREQLYARFHVPVKIILPRKLKIKSNMAFKLSKRTKMVLLMRRRTIAKNKYKKRFWVRRIFQERKQKGEYHLLLQDLHLHDHEYFFKCFRMSHSKYEELLWLQQACCSIY